MRRNEFLACTGLTIDQHGYMVRRNHLPFFEGKEPRPDGWADYSARQVYLTALAVALAPHVGGQAEAARRVVQLPAADLTIIWSALFQPELGDIWAVSYLYSEPATGHWEVERIGWSWDLVGVREGGRPAITFPAQLVGKNAETLTAINLSQIARGIAARAAAAGIKFPETPNA